MSRVNPPGHDCVMVGQYSQTRIGIHFPCQRKLSCQTHRAIFAAGLVKQHEAARSIIDSLPEKRRFILSIDGTSWKPGKFKYYVLAVGICFNGISLPICFVFFPGHDITSFVDEIGMMESVVSLVGRERIECLLADR